MKYVFVTERVAYELPDKFDASNTNTIMEMLENEELEEVDGSRIHGWIFDVQDIPDPEDIRELLEEWDGKHHPK